MTERISDADLSAFLTECRMMMQVDAWSGTSFAMFASALEELRERRDADGALLQSDVTAKKAAYEECAAICVTESAKHMRMALEAVSIGDGSAAACNIKSDAFGTCAGMIRKAAAELEK